MQTVMVSWLNLNADQNVQALVGRMSADDPHNQALSNYLFGKVNQL